MATYIKTFENKAAVNSALTEGTLSRPFIAYCTGNTKELFYGTDMTFCQIGDIIVYKVADGTKRFIPQANYNTTTYPVTDFVPIGVAVDYQYQTLDEEKLTVKFMSLKWMNYSTPDVGGSSTQNMYWGYNNFDIPEIPNCSDETAAKADMNGKANTAAVLNYATGQADWKTASAITNAYTEGIYPAFECAWRYHTSGTSQGDWWVPAAGEMNPLVTDTTVNDKVNAGLTACGGASFPISSNKWTSTEGSAGYAWYWNGSFWYNSNKYNNYSVRALSEALPLHI